MFQLSRRESLAAAVLALLPVLVFWRHTVGGGCIAREDSREIMMPMLELLRRGLHQGEVPLWNPYFFSGMPFAGHGNNPIYYLPNYLVAWLEPDRLIVWTSVLHSSLAALGMAALFRRWGFSDLASFVVGAAWGLGSPLYMEFERYQVPQILGLLPWVLLCCDLSMEQRRYAAPAAFLLTMQLFCAHPQHVYFTALVMGFLLFGVWGPQYGWGLALRRLALAGGLGLLGGAVMVLPLADHLRDNMRGLALPAYFSVYGMQWSDIPGSLAPELFPRSMAGLYPVPVLLTLLGLVGWFRRRQRGRLAGTAVAMIAVGYFLALANASALEPFLNDYLPLYAGFRYRLRFLVLVVLGVLWLAAIGLDALERSAPGRAATGLLLVVLWLDLAWLPASFHRAFSRSQVYELSAFQVLPEDPTFHRMLTAPWIDRKYWNWGIWAGRSNLGAYCATSSNRYQNVLHFAELGKLVEPLSMLGILNRNGIRVKVPFDAPILRILALRYVVYSHPGAPDVELFRRDDGVPHGFICADWEIVPDALGQLRRLSDPALNPARTAILGEMPAGLGKSAAAAREGNAPVEVSIPSPNRLSARLNWTGPEPAVLVFSEILERGWTATLDGAPAELFHVDYVLRGLVVPPGAHQVEMRYVPPGMALGGLLSGLTLLGLLGFFFAEDRHPKAGSPTA